MLMGDEGQNGDSCQAQLSEAQSAAAAAQKEAAVAQKEVAAARAMTAAAQATAALAQKEAAAAKATTAAATARAEAAEAALAKMTGQRGVLPVVPTAVRRREQDTVPVQQPPVLEARTDSTSGLVEACVASPCTMQGVCLNGGACEEASTVGASGSFRCSCMADNYGPARYTIGI